MTSVGARRVACHVLDHAGLLAGQLADAVVVTTRAGIQLGGLIHGSRQIRLRGLSGQIRA